MKYQKSNKLEYHSNILTIASKNVITLPPTTSIMGTVKTMLKYGFRRVPISDAGTNRLEGIVTSLDIVDFLGGGLRHNLVKNRYNSNLVAAVNEDVREIMKKEVVSLTTNNLISEALSIIIDENIGGIPILDEQNAVVAMVTERDFVRTMTDTITSKYIKEYMSNKVITAPPDLSVNEATRTMIKKGFRRLPVVKDEILIGIITASDIMRYMGSGEVFQKLMAENVTNAFQIPIKNLILQDVIWTTSDISISEAAVLMLKNKVGSLPIIDSGELCGILTERDIVRALSD